MMRQRLAGKVAIVTGSGRGIGRAIAEKFVSEGARVVINDLDADVAEAAAAELRAIGGDAIVCAGDVTAEAMTDRLVASALDTWGALDLIVNNAGYTWDSVIQKMTDEQWKAVIDLHLRAPFRLLRSAAEHFRAQAKADLAHSPRPLCRKVVNISSIAGLYGNAGQANYAAAKAGVVGLTKALAKEWGRYNVTVNCVAFGLISTRLTQVLGDGDASIDVQGRNISVGLQQLTLDAFRRAIPLGREGTVADAAGGVFLLCLPEADYITGQVLEVGGGLKI